ncbi:hypothetical protein AYO38_04790 [bacterium SCGC AG-212-C10]|nr:hypothetical protein AYO38_04790 [bacterium SCGC AG-212-C10]
MAEGLHGPLTILRDRWSIPHVKAFDLHDAYFAQGYCIAQDRMWQIELIRRMAEGRAARLLGEGLLKLDKQNRMLGFAYTCKDDWGDENQGEADDYPAWNAQSDDAKLMLGAYAEGVNEAIRTLPPPPEFVALDHTMEPWSPLDSLAIIRLVNSGAQWASKLKFAQLAAALGKETALAMIPALPDGASLIVPAGEKWTGDPHPFREDMSRAMGEPDGVVAAGGGSNCWVIHGSKTESGMPLVAGDPHLQMTLPGQWYVMHIECPEFTVAGPCNPGYPGPLFYGHNKHVAWTMTHAQGDRWDLYREKVRLHEPAFEETHADDRVSFRGVNHPDILDGDEWYPARLVEPIHKVRGQVVKNIFNTPAEELEPDPLYYVTRHGPVIFGEPWNGDEEVISARWGLDTAPVHDMDAILALHRSKNIAEARAALLKLDSVSGNFCLADIHGDIGYQYTGRIPKRPAWLVPVPGWDGEHEWDGDVPKEELPAETNPDRGYIITANNHTTTPDYPHYLTYTETRFRADRLNELFASHEGKFTVDEMRRFQADVTSVVARDLAPLFAAAPVTTEAGGRLRSLFAGWNGELATDSAAALAYDAVLEVLGRESVRRHLAQATAAPQATLIEERRILYEQIMADSTLMLPQGSTWQGLIGAALDEAGVALEARFGPDTSAWRWDAAHQLRLRHNLGRDPQHADLNLPPIPAPGDATTVFNTVAEHGGGVGLGVSYRQIFDLSDLNAAQICVVPGQSGDPASPHYADGIERWRNVEYHPLYINWDDIRANQESELVLMPSTDGGESAPGL